MLMTISDEQMILKKAHSLLTASGITKFPLRVKPIIDHLQAENDIQILKYTTMAKTMNVPVETVGFMVGSDEAALVYNGPGKPACIYYKDVYIPKERIRWNLGHEIAHYVCGHHLAQYRVKEAGLEMSKTAAARIEAEANFLTRAMHAPLELVLAFMWFYDIYHKAGVFTILRSIFRMSVPAAYYYTDQIFNRNIRQLVTPANELPFEGFFLEFTGTFNRDAFDCLLRSYEPEYSMFATDLLRRTQRDYRVPYQEDISTILERVLPRRMSWLGEELG